MKDHLSDLKIIVQILGQPIRADQALLQALSRQGIHLSRSKLKRSFHEKEIRLQNQSLKASELLPPGDYLLNWTPSSSMALDQILNPKAVPSTQGSFIPIVYEDNTLLILNKGNEIPSIPHHSKETQTAVNSALARCPEIAYVGRNSLEPGILHRLDTATSGLLVFAKTQEEFTRLQSLWKNRQIEKIYRAVIQTQKKIPKTPFTIDVSIAHDACSSKKMRVVSPHSHSRFIHFRGKPLTAITRILNSRSVSFSSIDTQTIDDKKNFFYDLEIQIETGVMHQIRCHLASVGLPLFGDSLYGGIPSKRLWLHAWKLKIPLKVSLGAKSFLCLEAQLPEEWPKSDPL